MSLKLARRVEKLEEELAREGAGRIRLVWIEGPERGEGNSSVSPPGDFPGDSGGGRVLRSGRR
jgi:hypothetical protein